MYSASVVDEFITVAQLRAEMATIIARLGKARGHIYLTQRGQPRAVLVDIKEFEALIEQLEYLDDSIEVFVFPGDKGRRYQFIANTVLGRYDAYDEGADHVDRQNPK